MSEMIMWSPGVSLADIEKQVILKAFRFYRGNKTTTSQALGISIRTLDARLEAYRSESEEQEQQIEKQRQERREFLNRSRGAINTNADGFSTIAVSENVTSSVSIDAGVHMEPASNTSSEQTMPMPKRREVQSVLPQHPSKSGQNRSR